MAVEEVGELLACGCGGCAEEAGVEAMKTCAKHTIGGVAFPTYDCYSCAGADFRSPPDFITESEFEHQRADYMKIKRAAIEGKAVPQRVNDPKWIKDEAYWEPVEREVENVSKLKEIAPKPPAPMPLFDKHLAALADLADEVAIARSNYERQQKRMRNSIATTATGAGLIGIGSWAWSLGFSSVVFLGAMIFTLGMLSFFLLALPPGRGKTPLELLQEAETRYARKQRRPE